MERINIWENGMPLFDPKINNKENEFAGTITPFLVEEEDEDIKKRGAICHFSTQK